MIGWNGSGGVLIVKEGTIVISDLATRGSGGSFPFDVILPDSVSYIGASFFSYGKVRNSKLPSNLVSIGSDGFGGFTINTKELILPEGLERIGYRAFSECKGFRTVVIPETVKIVEDHVFERSKDLKVIKIPKHLKGTFAYEGVARLIYY